MSPTDPPDPSQRPHLLRVLDANRNRALEALRVLEEHARLVLESPGLAAQARGLRHRLQAALDAPGLAGAVAHRAVALDPGRPVETDAPEARASLGDLLAANASRAKEALRVLEEYGKLVDPGAAAAVSRVRFDVYALEQALAAGRPSLASRRVYVVLGQPHGRALEQARACLDGGVRLLQLRAPGLPGAALLRVARELRALCEARGALLVVNDRPDVARLAGAHGVHVGRDDLPPELARAVVAPGALVGATAHDEAELRAAVAAGADYVGVGTLFASPTKPELPARGVELVRALAPGCPVPIYGIGGVTAETAASVVAAGAHGVAVSSAVVGAKDVAFAAAELVAIVERAAAAREASRAASGGEARAGEARAGEARP